MLKIKELRKELNLTQREFAEKLGLDAHNVGDWERGKCEPSSFWLIKISETYKVSTDYLLGREDDFGNVLAKTSNGAELSPAEWDFVRKMRALDPRHIKVLEMQLETLTELQAESLKK